MKPVVLWDVTSCSLVVTKHFGEACYLHHQGSCTLCHTPGDEIVTERKVNTAEGVCVCVCVHTHAGAVMKHLYAEIGRVMRNGPPWGMQTVTEAGKVSISGSDGTCNDALRAFRPQQYHIQLFGQEVSAQRRHETLLDTDTRRKRN
jgi:hypothetical protein